MKRKRLLIFGFIALVFLIQGLQTFGQNAPIFTSSPVTDALVGSQYLYNITATDANNDNLSFSVKSGTRLPAWLSFTAGGSDNISELISSGFGGEVAGMGIDEATGDIYISTQNSHNIYKYTPAGVLSVFGTYSVGLSYGNMIIRGTRLYMATWNGRFYSYDLTNTSGNATPTELAPISGIGLEYKDGYFYLCNYHAGRIDKINATDFTYTTYASFAPSVYFGIVFDGDGYLYATGFHSGTIIKIAPDGTNTTVLSGLSNPTDIKLGSNGDFYISSYNGGVRRYSSDFSTLVSSIAPSLNSWGMSFNSSGTLLIGESGSARKVWKLETGSVLSGTPQRSDIGVHPIGITVNDGTNDTHQEFDITVTGLALVTTAPASAVGPTTATIGGEVTETGGLPVTERGIVYSLSNQNPVIGASGVTKLMSGSGSGTFNETLSGLTFAANYYYNTYVINSNGTSYGTARSFTTSKIDQTITFNALIAKTYGDAAFSLTATASSTLAVSYASSNTTVATVSGSTVTIVGQGTTTITASQAGNATYNSPPNVQQTLTVNKKPVTITGVTAATKVYDGTTTAILSGGAVSTGVGTETLNITAGTGTFADKNVGTKAVTVTGYALANGANGGLASNYTLSAQPVVANQTITAKPVTITGVTTATKVYDGTTTAILSGGAVSTGVGTETLNITAGTGTFADKNVGTKAVTVTGYALANGANGGLASNYTLSAQPIVPNQAITAKELTVADAAVTTKVYDGNTDAEITGASLLGVVGADDVTLADANAGSFDNANAGADKPVTIAMTLSGAGTGNYTLAQPVLTGDITAKELTVADAAVTVKVYDGNNDAEITGASLLGVVGADDVTLTDANAGSFDNANAGADKPVTIAMTLSGTGTGNYTLAQPVLTGDITAKELTVADAAVTAKVYDGNTDAEITGASLLGVVGADDVTLANANAGSFDNANVGADKPVTTAMTLSGTGTGNYTLAQPVLTGDITAKELTVADAAVTTKVYDGNTDAEITGASLLGVVGADDVTLANAAAGSFDNANVGTDKAVTTSMTLSGAGIGNYALAQPVLSGDITAKTLLITGSFKVEDKNYDSTTDATINQNNLLLDGLVAEDNVILEAIAAFASPEIGENILVSLTVSTVITGTHAGNYVLSLGNAPSTTASIIDPNINVDLFNQSAFNMYPNPVSNVLTIETGTNKMLIIRVLSITGQEVFAAEITNRIQIDASSLQPGIYLVAIVDGNNQVIHKLIKR